MASGKASPHSTPKQNGKGQITRRSFNSGLAAAGASALALGATDIDLLKKKAENVRGPQPGRGSSIIRAAQPQYRYVPVNQFSPLSDGDWFVLQDMTGGGVDRNNPWRFRISVGSRNRSTGEAGSFYLVYVELISYYHNIFRIRFSPSVPIDPNKDTNLPDVVFGPVTQANLTEIRNNEIKAGAPPSGIFQYSNGDQLEFKTHDLSIELGAGFQLTVRNSNGTIIHQDTRDSHERSLGAAFVDPSIGTAVATVKVNSKDDSTVKERFYGQGQINARLENGVYTPARTGLSMTNFNYDQISYVHPELAPNAGGVDPSYPDYYFPMYFSAPWIIATGNQGTNDRYAYGLFLNNQSQSYTNTGDERFGASVGAGDKFYLGAQSGELDYFFVGGGATDEDQVANVVAGLSYLCSDPTAAWAQHAAMPPKYIFGYFQGVYGAVGLNADGYPSSDPKVDNGIFFEDILNGYNAAGIPLEGFAVDVDVQATYKVFTINDRFYLDGDNTKESVFGWAQQNGLVTQTNITCFVKDTDPSYGVYNSLVSKKLYMNNTRADGGTPFKNDGHGPSDAYCGQLQYGPNAKTTALFPDWGRNGTAEWWGGNYADLFGSGLDFVWQDMTTPSMDAHVIGSDISDDSFNLDTLKAANSASPGQSDTAYADTFNWRSYHLQAQLTDPRYGDGAKQPFAAVRNQHAYSLCSATYNQGIKTTAGSRSRFKRSYIIARGGQIGSQHFGGLWMGDNMTDWEHLKLMVPMIVSMNMSGVSVVGADIGGFAQGDSNYNPDEGEGNPASPELLTRWVQAGFLLPWFRNHYDRWLSLDPSSADDPANWQPKKHGKPYQELYNDAYNQTAAGTKTYRDAMRDAIELRYRWQEVLYTASYQNVSSGRPMINAMCNWWNDTNIDYDANPALDTQFLLGPNYEIMAGAITDQSATSRDIYFPGNTDWFPFFPGMDDDDISQYQPGGAKVSVNADVTQTPVYVQKGAKLPTRYTLDGSSKAINKYTTDDPLVFDIFSASGSDLGNRTGIVYLDDGGVTTDAEDNSKYSVLELAINGVTDTSVTYDLAYDFDAAYTWSAPVYLRLRAVGTVTDVSVGGASADKLDATDKYAFFKAGSPSSAAYWLDSGSGSVWVRVPALSTPSSQASIAITCSDTIDRSKSL